MTRMSLPPVDHLALSAVTKGLGLLYMRAFRRRARRRVDDTRRVEAGPNHSEPYADVCSDPDLLGVVSNFGLKSKGCSNTRVHRGPQRASIMSVFPVIPKEKPWRIVCGRVFPSMMDR